MVEITSNIQASNLDCSQITQKKVSLAPIKISCHALEGFVSLSESSDLKKGHLLNLEERFPLLKEPLLLGQASFFGSCLNLGNVW